MGASDRTAIGAEIQKLTSEINNIATRTKFNGQNLLTGALSVSTATALGPYTATGDTFSVGIDVSKA
ncbi:MAG: hypothetical protein EXR66_00390 [Dehalococcoidia bacterium]|nr:hypothetical protein [Dehalococcoidia bacterium]